MSEAMLMDEEFDRLLRGALQDRRVIAEAPAGFEQRLQARLAQEAITRDAQPFCFAEAIRTPRSAASTWFAIGAHATVLLLLAAAISGSRQVLRSAQPATISMLVVPPPVLPRPSQSGGGGGAHDHAPAAQGHLPKLAQTQIVPPKAPPTIPPMLAVEPSVVVQKDLKMANNTMPNLGDPKSSLHGVSMGDGAGGGLGSGRGNGIGPGSGGNIGGGIEHIGGLVSKPIVLYSVEPEFSEEARKAKFSGNVQVYLIVDELGNPSHVRVVRGVGMGLDEKAKEAVLQYKFKPAMKNGKPVKVDLYIDVNFQIF
jgi:protein TonB